MIIDSKTIEPYKKFLGSLPMLNKGMQRLHKFTLQMKKYSGKEKTRY